MKATNLEPLQLILDFDDHGKLFDFHNDYTVHVLTIKDKTIKIIFKSIKDLKCVIQLVFTNIDVVCLKYQNSHNDYDKLNTMLMFQRMKYVCGDEIVETQEGRALIRLEFEYHIERIDFWCDEILLFHL